MEKKSFLQQQQFSFTPHQVLILGGYSSYLKTSSLIGAECTLDPNCLKEKGACFACLYVPEFVCGYFNKFLDRDVLIGKERYRKGFWDW